MSTANLKNLQQWAGQNGWAVQGLAAPILVVAILALMVLPIAPWMLDTFFTLNIAIALMVMMVAAYMLRPLDFAAFPSVLLLTTLMRLSLNVASTRVVLLEGHQGPGAAGAVIEAFGHFLIGGNFAVGLIVFAILVVINFVVITKGAERIAEVSARFTLDAMPGKQMAVDADLNAGLIDEKEAKRRRAEVAEEANFFGSMDGASKFVRGDAVAGILILLINIIGGFTIGVLQHDLSAKQAADSYILLAIGDALVAQIPGLLISVAAAMVISRVGKEQDMGGQIVRQLFMSPRVLGVTAGILILLAAFIGGKVQGAGLGEMVSVLKTTIINLRFTILTIITVIATAKVMGYAGMTHEIAETAVAATGTAYPAVAAFIGSIGTFITGSATSSCVLFGKLQTDSAIAIGASPAVQAWITSANATGACAGKMISPQSIAIAVAAIGITGADGKLLHFAVKVYLPFIIIMGLVVYFGQLLIG